MSQEKQKKSKKGLIAAIILVLAVCAILAQCAVKNLEQGGEGGGKGSALVAAVGQGADLEKLFAEGATVEDLMALLEELEQLSKTRELTENEKALLAQLSELKKALEATGYGKGGPLDSIIAAGATVQDLMNRLAELEEAAKTRELTPEEQAELEALRQLKQTLDKVSGKQADKGPLDSLIQSGASVEQMLNRLAELEAAAKTRDLTPEEQAELEALRELKKTLEGTGYGKGGPLDSMIAAGATVQDLMNRLAELEEAAKTRDLTAKEQAELAALRELKKTLDQVSGKQADKGPLDSLIQSGASVEQMLNRLAELEAAAKTRDLTPEEQAELEALRELKKTLEGTGYGKGGPLDSMIAAGATVQDLMNRLAELEEAAKTRDLTAKEQAELAALRELKKTLDQVSGKQAAKGPLDNLIQSGASVEQMLNRLAELEAAAKTRELTPEEEAELEALRELKKALEATGYGKVGPLDSMIAAGATVQDLMNRLAELEEAAKTRDLTAKEQAELEALRQLKETLEKSASAETMNEVEQAAQARALAAAEQARQDSIAAAEKKKELTPEEKAARDSLKRLNDSLSAVEKLRKDSLKQVADSLRADSLARAKENARIADSLAKLAQDSIPPTVSLTPPPGRYYEPIKLKAKCDEIKCNSWISVGDTLNPQDAKKGVEYNKSGIVFFRAQDSAGNYSEWQTGEYNMASDNKCGKYSYPVPVGGKEVCVDAYEYPNKPEEVPRDMVSHAQAASLCEAEGKRLCTIDEWKSACMGRETQRYSYGNSYIANRCNTNTSAVLRTGRRTQCRSWWGMYDMNGNLWEWTATPSKEKAGAYLAAGGSWSGNNQTRCTESSYSFYTQNQYPSVGFRCCKDSP